jgi:murein DD-endopeptidase MepM/ murein hydrolase activator NlpD
MFEGYRITSKFGFRIDPVNGGKAFHQGIDLVKPHRSPIESFTDGEVLFSGEGVKGSGFGGYGNVVAVLDSAGALHCYAHLDECKVEVGDKIKKGDIVGLQGSTGKSTGSHLHYEIRKKSKPSFGWKAIPEMAAGQTEEDFVEKLHVYNPTEYLESFEPEAPKKADIEVKIPETVPVSVKSQPVPKSSGSEIYTVKTGDSLNRIIKKLGLKTQKELIDETAKFDKALANRLTKNPNLLRIGDKLYYKK